MLLGLPSPPPLSSEGYPWSHGGAPKWFGDPSAEARFKPCRIAAYTLAFGPARLKVCEPFFTHTHRKVLMCNALPAPTVMPSPLE